MIDAATYAALRQAIADARTQGVSLPELLDRRDLLNTVAYRSRTIRRILEKAHTSLDKQGAPRLMMWRWGRHNGTPSEMFTAVLDWLEAYLAKEAANPDT